jgi:hypothetical protein
MGLEVGLECEWATGLRGGVRRRDGIVVEECVVGSGTKQSREGDKVDDMS